MRLSNLFTSIIAQGLELDIVQTVSGQTCTDCHDPARYAFREEPEIQFCETCIERHLANYQP